MAARALDIAGDSRVDGASVVNAGIAAMSSAASIDAGFAGLGAVRGAGACGSVGAMASGAALASSGARVLVAVGAVASLVDEAAAIAPSSAVEIVGADSEAAASIAS
jgi:hypothetical protein